MYRVIILSVIMAFLLLSCKQTQPANINRRSDIDSLFLNPVFSETFDSLAQNKLKNNWFQTLTGNDVPGKWEAVHEQGNKAVGQMSDKSSGYLFNLLIYNNLNLKNLAISASFKAVAGNEDQGGGLVWRYQDSSNYYIARANPLENNFRVYKVVNGNRKQLKSYSLPVTAGEWHDITVVHRDSLIRCYYDYQLFLEVIDNEISLTGKTGFWTKADAQTWFDNLKIQTVSK